MTTRTMTSMRSTSTSSNPGERGLFRLLVGAALALAGWRAFWKWALPKPKRGAASVLMMSQIMKDAYLEPLKQMMRQDRVLVDVKAGGLTAVMDREVKGAIDDHRIDVLRYMMQVPKAPPLTKWEKRKMKFKRWLKGYKPVIMTQKKKEELEDYY